MGGGLGVLDIILFAMLAAFLIYRLGSVLGKRTGNEQRRPEMFGGGRARDAGKQDDNVISLPDRASDRAESGKPQSPLEAGLTQIKIADRRFDEKGFLEGARAAFEMVVMAFAAGDTETLRNLLSDDVYENFAAAIRDREAKSETLESTVVGIDHAEIVEAEMDDRQALVTVKYISEQVNATRAADGTVVSGDPATVVRVTDIWTFARDVSTSDPNWTLVATRSSN